MRSSILILLFRNNLKCHHHHHHHQTLASLPSSSSLSSLVLISKRFFFELPFQKSSSDSPSSSSSSENNRKEFTDQRIVRFTPLQIYNVVANVDDYDQFLPNCLESNVILKKSNYLEAELLVGFPPLITEKYKSLVYLEKPKRVLVKGIDSKILKHLQSEWNFELIENNRTLVTFNVEFEFYSKLHNKFMSLFFDDFTKKTMQAFLDRTYIIYTADPLYFDK